MTGARLSSDKENGQIEGFRQANYSVREIDKELNQSQNVARSYLKASEECGTKKTMEDSRN